MSSHIVAGRREAECSAPRDDDRTFTVTLPRNFTGRVKLIIDVDPDEPLPPNPTAAD